MNNKTTIAIVCLPLALSVFAFSGCQQTKTTGDAKPAHSLIEQPAKAAAPAEKPAETPKGNATLEAKPASIAATKKSAPVTKAPLLADTPPPNADTKSLNVKDTHTFSAPSFVYKINNVTYTWSLDSFAKSELDKAVEKINTRKDISIKRDHWRYSDSKNTHSQFCGMAIPFPVRDSTTVKTGHERIKESVKISESEKKTIDAFKKVQEEVERLFYERKLSNPKLVFEIEILNGCDSPITLEGCTPEVFIEKSLKGYARPLEQYEKIPSGRSKVLFEFPLNETDKFRSALSASEISINFKSNAGAPPRLKDSNLDIYDYMKHESHLCVESSSERVIYAFKNKGQRIQDLLSQLKAQEFTNNLNNIEQDCSRWDIYVDGKKVAHTQMLTIGAHNVLIKIPYPQKQVSWDKPRKFVLGKEENREGILLEMRPIPCGKFKMGSPPDEIDREGNEDQKNVTISTPFLMSETEITQLQYLQVMGENPSLFKQDLNPVENVSWNDAKKFCEKLTQLLKEELPSNVIFDLPTEAQWEYACRAGTKERFYTGIYAADLRTAAHFDAHSHHPVKGKKPNKWGLYDMHGNVWEWTLDIYNDHLIGGTDPVRKIKDKKEAYTYRVARGGSWRSPAHHCRSALRLQLEESVKQDKIGFRVVLIQKREK